MAGAISTEYLCPLLMLMYSFSSLSFPFLFPRLELNRRTKPMPFDEDFDFTAGLGLVAARDMTGLASSGSREGFGEGRWNKLGRNLARC